MAALAARGAEGVFAPVASLRTPLTLRIPDQPGSLWSADAFIVRALPPWLEAPMVETATTSTQAFAAALQRAERAFVVESALLARASDGVPVFNPPVPESERKPLQLLAFARAGLAIPRTCVTTDVNDARAFINAEHAVGCGVIVKPVVGGATARLVDNAVLARLDGIVGQPVILQERIVGSDLRVTVIDDVVVSAVRYPDRGQVDIRDTPGWSEGDVDLEAVAVDDTVADVCVRAARACGHRFAGVDVKLRRDGTPVVLESNGAPTFLGIERAVGVPITALLVDAVLRAVDTRG